MKVHNLLARKGPDVATVAPDRSVRDALQLLVDRGIGSLVVMEDGVVEGIVTERDVLRTVNQDPAALAERTVGDVMTRDILVARPTDSVQYAMDVMTRNRIRHLPVVNDGSLEGLISIGDVVDLLREDAETENRYLKDYVQGLTR